MNAARMWIASLAVLLPTMAFGHQGSMDEQVACTPDVYRLCASRIPDEDAIVACLKQNRAALSPPCQKVFSTPDRAGEGQSGDDD